MSMTMRMEKRGIGQIKRGDHGLRYNREHKRENGIRGRSRRKGKQS